MTSQWSEGKSACHLQSTRDTLWVALCMLAAYAFVSVGCVMVCAWRLYGATAL